MKNVKVRRRNERKKRQLEDACKALKEKVSLLDYVAKHERRITVIDAFVAVCTEMNRILELRGIDTDEVLAAALAVEQPSKTS